MGGEAGWIGGDGLPCYSCVHGVSILRAGAARGGAVAAATRLSLRAPWSAAAARCAPLRPARLLEDTRRQGAPPPSPARLLPSPCLVPPPSPRTHAVPVSKPSPCDARPWPARRAPTSSRSRGPSSSLNTLVRASRRSPRSSPRWAAYMHTHIYAPQPAHRRGIAFPSSWFSFVFFLPPSHLVRHPGARGLAGHHLF